MLKRYYSFWHRFSPIAVVFPITKDTDGNTIFNPSITTIKQYEVLILNNYTVGNSFNDAENSENRSTGKLFDSGTIQTKGFIESLHLN
jgi:hypothetical protein